MRNRIFLFIIIGIAIENSWHLWDFFGYSDDYIYYTVFPFLQKLEMCLLPAWWVNELIQSHDKDRNAHWSYLVAATYLLFQVMDAFDMLMNENTRSPVIDFILFGILNVIYWLIFRKR